MNSDETERHRKKPRRQGEADGAMEEITETEESESLVIAKLLKELREMDEKLKEKDEKLNEKDEKLKEKDEKLKEKDGQLKRFSVMKLLENMPFMRVNPSALPSVIPNELAQEQVQEYQDSYRKYQEELVNWKNSKDSNVPKPNPPTPLKFHEPAQIEIRKLDAGLFDSFDVHLKDRDDDWIQSALKMKVSRSTDHMSLPHHNETSPQDYLATILDDVIECCGFLGEFEVMREASLFSLRPDLVVVIVQGRLLLAIEVKNPIVKKDNENDLPLFSYETAAGQTLNYLKALKQQGIDWPFALFSTYNESVIAYLSQDSNEYNKILSQASENAKTKPAERHKSLGGQKTPHFKKTKNDLSLLSPNRPGLYQKISAIPAYQSHRHVSETPDVKDEEVTYVALSKDMKSNKTFNYRGRKVVFSQVFGADKLFKALVLLVESSYISFHKSQETPHTLMPEEGALLPSKEMCTLYSNGFFFERVRNNVKVTYSTPPKFKYMRKYHVLCQVGQGGTGRTILCSSANGKLFAAKIFLIDTPMNYAECNKNEEQESMKAEKEKEAKAEWKRWMNLAPKQYNEYCNVIQLNGLPAITMPYFPPVSMEEREKALGPIKKCLQEVANKGLYYNGDGLRWCHFGCRWLNMEPEEMEITLLDLGSLGQKPMDIDKQVNELRATMKDETEQFCKPIIV